MLDIKKLIAKMLNALKVDYIVAEGAISADTRYRKWNSGKAECWYHRTVSGITTAVWTTPVYYQDSTAFGNIWNGVFNTAPRSVVASSNYSQVQQNDKMIISQQIRQRSVMEGMQMESITIDEWLKHIESM